MIEKIKIIYKPKGFDTKYFSNNNFNLKKTKMHF